MQGKDLKCTKCSIVNNGFWAIMRWDCNPKTCCTVSWRLLPKRSKCNMAQRLILSEEIGEAIHFLEQIILVANVVQPFPCCSEQSFCCIRFSHDLHLTNNRSARQIATLPSSCFLIAVYHRTIDL